MLPICNGWEHILKTEQVLAKSHANCSDTPALSLKLRLSTTKRHVPTAILSLKLWHQISNAKGADKHAISYILTLHPICFTNRCGAAVSGSFQHPAALVLLTKAHYQENPSIAVSLGILRYSYLTGIVCRVMCHSARNCVGLLLMSNRSHHPSQRVTGPSE